MDHATQVALLRRIFGLLDAHTTEMADAPYRNHVTTYTSASQLERERVVLFRREPLFAGLTCDAAEAGAYFVHADAGVPVLVVRAGTRELRAFVALCRHRGAQVVSSEGTSTGRFTCPYHGWTYGDDGRLLTRPCPEAFPGLSPESSSL